MLGGKKKWRDEERRAEKKEENLKDFEVTALISSLAICIYRELCILVFTKFMFTLKINKLAHNSPHVPFPPSKLSYSPLCFGNEEKMKGSSS